MQLLAANVCKGVILGENIGSLYPHGKKREFLGLGPVDQNLGSAPILPMRRGHLRSAAFGRWGRGVFATRLLRSSCSLEASVDLFPSRSQAPVRKINFWAAERRTGRHRFSNRHQQEAKEPNLFLRTHWTDLSLTDKDQKKNGHLALVGHVPVEGVEHSQIFLVGNVNFLMKGPTKHAPTPRHFSFVFL